MYLIGCSWYLNFVSGPFSFLFRNQMNNYALSQEQKFGKN